MKLYGITEIAREIDMLPNTVTVWYKRGKLPKPTAVLSMGPIWTGKVMGPWLRKYRENGN